MTSSFSSSSIKVSIHASSREDATTPLAIEKAISCFNPRVLTGGRDKIFQLPAIFELFQSTRPHGRTRPVPIYNINPGASRVLTGGRDKFHWRSAYRNRFQSTRPHGRTRLAFIFYQQGGVRFQSTRPHGRTRLAPNRSNRTAVGFQPTRPPGRTRLLCTIEF